MCAPRACGRHCPGPAARRRRLLACGRPTRWAAAAPWVAATLWAADCGHPRHRLHPRHALQASGAGIRLRPRHGLRSPHGPWPSHGWRPPHGLRAHHARRPPHELRAPLGMRCGCPMGCRHRSCPSMGCGYRPWAPRGLWARQCLLSHHGLWAPHWLRPPIPCGARPWEHSRREPRCGEPSQGARPGARASLGGPPPAANKLEENAGAQGEGAATGCLWPVDIRASSMAPISSGFRHVGVPLAALWASSVGLSEGEVRPRIGRSRLPEPGCRWHHLMWWSPMARSESARAETRPAGWASGKAEQRETCKDTSQSRMRAGSRRKWVGVAPAQPHSTSAPNRAPTHSPNPSTVYPPPAPPSASAGTGTDPPAFVFTVRAGAPRVCAPPVHALRACAHAPRRAPSARERALARAPCARSAARMSACRAPRTGPHMCAHRLRHAVPAPAENHMRARVDLASARADHTSRRPHARTPRMPAHARCSERALAAPSHA